MPYVRELFVGMPHSTKLQLFDYGTDGNYGYYKSQLRDLMVLYRVIVFFFKYVE